MLFVLISSAADKYFSGSHIFAGMFFYLIPVSERTGGFFFQSMKRPLPPDMSLGDRRGLAMTTETPRAPLMKIKKIKYWNTVQEGRGKNLARAN